MNDYIERDTVIKEQKRFCGYLDDDTLFRLELAIKRIPAADVRPVKRGKWSYDWGESIRCSACGETVNGVSSKSTSDLFDFCPNCGADMRQEDEA